MKFQPFSIMTFKPFFNDFDFVTICEEAYKTAKARQSPEGQSRLNIMLHYIGELSEASMAIRKGRLCKVDEKTLNSQISKLHHFTHEKTNYTRWFEQRVKNTVEDELADCFLVASILIGKTAFHRIGKGLDVPFSLTGGRKPLLIFTHDQDFDEIVYSCIKDVNYFVDHNADDDCFKTLVANIEAIARHFDIKLDLFIRAKMKYNELRSGKNWA